MVGEKMSENLIRTFYNIYKPFVKDDIHQHMKEHTFHLSTIKKEYLTTLNSDEKLIYNELTLIEKDTFRICRDLASFSDEFHPPPKFHLSYQELANRLDILSTQALRIMNKFKSYGLVDLVENGLKYRIGRRRRASIWKWNLSLTERTK